MLTLTFINTACFPKKVNLVNCPIYLWLFRLVGWVVGWVADAPVAPLTLTCARRQYSPATPGRTRQLISSLIKSDIRAPASRPRPTVPKMSGPALLTAEYRVSRSISSVIIQTWQGSIGCSIWRIGGST